MRYLPSGSVALNEDQIAAGNEIKSQTMQNLMKVQGEAYGHLSSKVMTLYLGDFETSENPYSVINEGVEPGYQLDEWRPTITPIRKMQDDLQTPYDDTARTSRKMIDGNYYIIASGYGSGLDARLMLYPLHESSITTDGGAVSLSTTVSYTIDLEFGSALNTYNEVWTLVSDMTGSAAGAITGYRGELTAQTNSTTGYMKYFSIEEAPKINHSTYIDDLKFYGSEIVNHTPTATAISSWNNDGAETSLVQSNTSYQPTVYRDSPVTDYIHSAYFDGGSSDILQTSANIKLNHGFYFAVSVYPSTSAGVRYILDLQDNTHYCARIFLTGADVLSFASRHSTGTAINSLSGPAIAENTWTDIACCIYPDPKINGTVKKEIWINGALYAQTSLGAFDFDLAGPSYIGNASSLTVPFIGRIAMPTLIDISPAASGSFGLRDINGLNLSWRKTWGL